MNPVWKIAWRNLWRNPRRSLLTMSALAFSSVLLIFMFAWQHGAYQAMIRSAVNMQTGPLQILADDYQDEPDIRKVIHDPDRLLARLDAMSSVRTATPRAEGFALVSTEDRSQGVMIIAIDADRETRITTLHQTLREGTFFGDNAPDEAVLGARLAKNLRASLGDELVVLGQAYDGSTAAGFFRVTGIVETGQSELDRSLMFVRLPTFQDTYFMESTVHRIVVDPVNFDDLAELQTQLAAELPAQSPALAALGWSDLLPGLQESIELDRISAYVMYVILLIVVTFSIANTFFMAVFERLHEFGVMRAIGTTPQKLSRMLLLETCLLAAVGILAGALIGIALTYWAQVVGIPMGEAGEMMREYGMPDRLHTRLSWLIVFTGPAFVLLVALAASILPVLRVRRLKPVEALSTH